MAYETGYVDARAHKEVARTRPSAFRNAEYLMNAIMKYYEEHPEFAP